MPRAPSRNCRLCPRLAAYRESNRADYAEFFNAPVPSFGASDAKLLVVGLAPGLKGANRTGRPFTGDYAGDLLYATLAKFGLSRGRYRKRADDGLELRGCRITNAVRCVPPENKPTGDEIKTCSPFLEAELTALPGLEAVLALGTIAHRAVIAALQHRQGEFPFKHGALHRLPGGLWLADSYHCSRYNTNTGRLTPEMFESVFEQLLRRIA